MKKWFKGLLDRLRQQKEALSYKIRVRLAVMDYKFQIKEVMKNVKSHSDNIHCKTVVEFLWLYGLVEHLYKSKRSNLDLLIELKEMFKDYTFEKSNPQTVAGCGFKLVLEIVLEKYNIEV